MTDSTPVPFPRRRQTRIGDLISDRGYTYKDTFSVPAHQLGFDIHMDLHPGQRKKQQKFEGALAIDGGVFCPALPPKFRNLPPMPKDPESPAVKALAALYDERANYAFKVRKNHGDGRLSIECPARAGMVRCPHAPKSMATTSTAKITIKKTPYLPKDPDRAKDSMRCCTSAVNILPADIAWKERQKFLYGTTKWVKSYGRRAAVEFANSLLREHYGCIDRGWTRTFNETNTFVLLGVLAAVTNTRHLRQWTKKNGGPDPVHTDWRPYPAQRTRKPSGTWDDLSKAGLPMDDWDDLAA